MANVMSGSGKFNGMYDLFMSAMHQRKQIINNLYIHQGNFPYVAINFDQQKNFLSQLASSIGRQKTKIENITKEYDWGKIEKFYSQYVLINTENLRQSYQNDDLADSVLKQTFAFASPSVPARNQFDWLMRISGVINYFMQIGYLDFVKINEGGSKGKPELASEEATLLAGWEALWESVFDLDKTPGDIENVPELDNDQYAKVYQNFKDLIKELDEKIDSLSGNDDVLSKGIVTELKIILKYVMERGVKNLNQLRNKQKKGSYYEDIVNDKDMNIKNYQGSKEELKKRAKDKKAHFKQTKLKGSFNSTVSKNTKIELGRFIEGLAKEAFDFDITFNTNNTANNITWKANTTGSRYIYGKGKEYNRSRVRVTDLEVEIPNITLSVSKDNNIQISQDTGTTKVNFSAKNYKPGSNVTGYTASNIDSYANTLALNGVPENLRKKLTGNEFKYYLLNEKINMSEKSSFTPEISRLLSLFGPLVSFSLFLEGTSEKNGGYDIMDRIDFLLINGKVIPAIAVLLDLKKNLSQGTKFSVTISNVSRPQINREGISYKHEKVTTEKGKRKEQIIEYSGGLYTKPYLEAGKGASKQLIKDMSFTTHIQHEYRTNLEQKVLEKEDEYFSKMERIKKKYNFKGGI